MNTMRTRNLSKAGATSLIWGLIILALIYGAWYFFFNKEDGKTSPFDKIVEGAGNIGTSAGNAMNELGETINDYSGNHHKNPEYQAKLKKLRSELKGKMIGTRFLSEDVVKQRAKTLHSELGSYNEDEGVIYSTFLRDPKSEGGKLILSIESPEFIVNNAFVQKHLITRADFYAIMYHWGLDNEDKNLIEKLQSNVSEWSVMYDGFPQYFRGGTKNVYSYLKKKYAKPETSERYKHDAEIFVNSAVGDKTALLKYIGL